MILLPAGVRVWLATSYADLRKGFPSPALQLPEILIAPRSAAIYLLPRSSRQSAEGDLV